MSAKLNEFRRRRDRRWWLVGATLAAAVAFGVVFVGASGAGLSSSPFEGDDGNLVVDTANGTDWASSSIQALPSFQKLVDIPSGTSDNSFTQGTHEDDPNVTIATGSIPPNKNDLTRSYIASETISGETFLYLAWERLVNTGSANLDFELDQTGTPFPATGDVTIARTEGDMLITYDFGGSGTPDLGLLTWLTSGNGHTNADCDASGGKLPCWGNRVDLNPTSTPPATAAVNTATIAEPIIGGGTTLDAGLFGEAKIDLSAIPGFFNPGQCKNFGSMFVKSRSSGSSIDAELKDFIAPQPILVSNCGSLKIVKNTVGGDGTFDFTSTGSLPSPADGSGNFSVATSSNTGSQEFKNLLPGNQYKVTETVPAGWKLTGLSCTTGGSRNDSTAEADITIQADTETTCTYENTKQATLSVTKVLVPANDTGKFNLQINGTTKAANVGNGGTTGAVSEDPGAYTVGETAGTGTDLANYDAVITGDCDAAGHVTLAAGQDASCTITNTHKSTLTVNKVCVPANDGGHFNLQIDAATAGTGANAACGGTTGALVEPAGAHTVGETAGTSTDLGNYNSVIDGACAANGSITLAAGQNAVCTITNTHKATLTVNKVCVPANDGGAFNLQIDSATAGTGANAACGGTTGAVVVTAAAHTVGETAGTGTNLSNYTSVIGGACSANGSVTLAAGDNKVCTITNTRKPTLTVTKVCVPANDGGAFNLQIDSATAGTGANAACGGTTGAVVETIGGHTVGETAGTGTNLSNYTSVTAGDCAANGSVTLAAGDNKACTITNTRKPTLTVNKVCLPANDTGHFNLQIDSATAGTGADAACGGTTGAVVETIGAHTVGETAGTGTDLSKYVSSIDGACAANGSVTLAAGQNAVCTITNSKSPTLTVNKVCAPTNDDGAFNLQIDSANAGTGANAACGGTTGVVAETVGKHTVGETAGTGTDLSHYVSTIGGACAADGSITLSEGQAAVCTITNTRKPTITIVKNTVGGDDTFSFSGPDDGTFDITTVAGTGQQGFEVVPGDYTVAEDLSVLSPWKLTGLSCNTGGSVDEENPAQADITVGPGDNVRCTFTNTKNATLIVKKVVDNSNGGGSKSPSDFTIHVTKAGLDVDGSPQPGTSTGTTYSLAPDTYLVGEDAVSGYSLTGITGGCLSTGFVQLAAGTTVTCTLTNKSAAPPPPPSTPPTPPAPKIDLSITKIGTPNPATLGKQITWTMVVTNNGPNGATGVTVADPIPAGTSFVSVATTQGTCTGGAVVSCQLGNMAVGSSVTITLVTTATATGTLTNTATTVGNEVETNTANNSATASVVVNGVFVPPVQYCTALAVSPKSLFVGRHNVLTMRVSRHGKPMAGVRIRIKGSTISVVTKPSNSKGVVKRAVFPKKAGIVTFVPIAKKSCSNPRIGVIGVFTPPVTG